MLAEIYAYQSAMDNVRYKGQGQIGRYLSSNFNIKNVIEMQLGNVQSSYNALLNTALQIKVTSRWNCLNIIIPRLIQLLILLILRSESTDS